MVSWAHWVLRCPGHGGHFPRHRVSAGREKLSIGLRLRGSWDLGSLGHIGNSGAQGFRDFRVSRFGDLQVLVFLC